MKDTPLPFTVRARMKNGFSMPFSRAARISANAPRIEPKSWPSTSIECQPNERNFSSTGSIGITSETGPSIWPPLLSRITQRFESLYFAADIAASQIWPS